MRCLLKAVSIMAAVQLFTAISAFAFHQDPSLDPETPFVICENQQYALCAEASCFVYDGVAYCECDILKGDSISLQLSYSSPVGDRTKCCDVNRARQDEWLYGQHLQPPRDEAVPRPSTLAPDRRTREVG